MSSHTYKLSDFPRVIEPTSRAIELTLDGKPRVFERLPASAQPEDVRNLRILDVVHIFFGGAYSNIILGYDAGGVLTQIFWRANSRWHGETAPVEQTGRPLTLPSLRLTFKKERDREVFLYYLRQVQRGEVQNVNVSMMLDTLAEPIRDINVGAL